MKPWMTFSSCLAAALLLGSGCAGARTQADAVSKVASINGDHNITGEVTFTQQGDGVLVVADLNGLTPGKHGIHIHENGDCGGVKAAAAGGHFNPTAQSHGMGGLATSHEGDLGNVTADYKGHARLSFVDPQLKLSGDNNIVGRAVIVHAQEDDLVGQPAGNSGDRVACGVILSVR